MTQKKPPSTIVAWTIQCAAPRIIQRPARLHVIGPTGSEYRALRASFAWTNLVHRLTRGGIQVLSPCAATADETGAGRSGPVVTLSDADWGTLPDRLNLTGIEPPGTGVNDIPSSVDEQGCFAGKRRWAPFVATSYPPAFRPGRLNWLSQSSAAYSLRLYLMSHERFDEWYKTRRRELDMTSNRQLEGDEFSTERIFWFLDTNPRNDRMLASLKRLQNDVRDGAIPCLYTAQMLVPVAEDGRAIEEPDPARRAPFKMRFQSACSSVRKAFALAPEVGTPDPREGLAATLRQVICLAPFAE